MLGLSSSSLVATTRTCSDTASSLACPERRRGPTMGFSIGPEAPWAGGRTLCLLVRNHRRAKRTYLCAVEREVEQDHQRRPVRRRTIDATGRKWRTRGQISMRGVVTQSTFLRMIAARPAPSTHRWMPQACVSSDFLTVGARHRTSAGTALLRSRTSRLRLLQPTRAKQR